MTLITNDNMDQPETINPPPYENISDPPNRRRRSRNRNSLRQLQEELESLKRGANNNFLVRENIKKPDLEFLTICKTRKFSRNQIETSITLQFGFMGLLFAIILSLFLLVILKNTFKFNQS